MAAAMSPSSSPRLPSPPPIAEDQLGPKSPTAVGMTSMDTSLFTAQQEANDKNASRRIRPGTKSASMPCGPPLAEISELDSASQVAEHLRALYNAAIHPDPSDPSKTVPIDRDAALKLSSPPPDIDKVTWLYELCRFLCQKLNYVIIALFADDPPCSAQTCVEMRASEWQYLCAVHDPPKMCCAIDYCCHTMDWAANILTNQKHFPSKLISGEGGPAQNTPSPHAQMKQLTNIYRRVYRVFAHAWFQHREVFWKVEKESGLYIFFKTVCDVYGLNPGDNCTVPPEAEGKEPAKDFENATEGNGSEDAAKVTETITREQAPSPPELGPNSTARKHRANPSVDSGTILTVLEELEEDGAPGEKKAEKSKLKEVAIPEEIAKEPTKEPEPAEEPEIKTPVETSPKERLGEAKAEIIPENGEPEATAADDKEDLPKKTSKETPKETVELKSSEKPEVDATKEDAKPDAKEVEGKEGKKDVEEKADVEKET